MKIVISGASGKTGFRIAEESLTAGYQTKILIRNSSTIPDSLQKCKKSIINLSKKEDLDIALRGNDALIIATGARPSIDLTGPAKIDALGVVQQVESCKRVGIKRIILVSSLCSGKLFHPLNLFGLILIWKRIGEKNLEKSGVNWTIIRPGGLNEKEEDINKEKIYYSESNQQEEGSIPRRLVARTCIESLKVESSIGKIIEITSAQKHPKTNMKEALKSFNI
tara:strand:+ start:1775 stop:2443 length:669 start_codon:yes stop_codon:yes gene_type:complete